MNDVLIINDKIYAPFLLAASFNGLIEFIGHRSANGILYWQFSPKDNAQKLLDQFRTKTEPNLPAQDIFQAITTWWQEIAEMKKGEIRNGRNKE